MVLVILRAILTSLALMTYPIVVGAISLVRGYDLDYSMKMRTYWAKALIRILGIEIICKGDVPNGNHLYIGNHRSYLDPIIALCYFTALPVAKAEVHRWPIIGWAASVSGILFVKREQQSSRKQTLIQIKELLNEKKSVLIYPEGTTHDLSRTIAFKTGVFKLAANHQFSVVPIMLDYENKDMYWIGDDTFTAHFVRTFGRKKSRAIINFGPVLSNNDPDQLLNQSKSWIDKKMLEYAQENH